MEMMKNLFGLADLYVPAVATNEKVLGDIQEMLDSVPIPAPLAMGPMGQPVPSGPPQPSKKLEFYEDPPSEYLVYKQWLMSEEARTAKQVNQDGYMNVYLYAQMLQQTVQKLQQQAQASAANQGIFGLASNIAGMGLNFILPGAGTLFSGLANAGMNAGNIGGTGGNLGPLY